MDEKTNEISAIPRLLEMLDVAGCLITLDAEGCQREIVETAQLQGADYVITVKENQPSLLEDIGEYFEDALSGGFRDQRYEYLSTVDTDHRRIERREYYQTTDIEWLEQRGEWNGLRSIGMVQGTRESGEEVNEQQQRYYISSLALDAQRFAEAVRVAIGELRTNSTGCWMWGLVRTTAVFVRKTRQKTSPYFVA